jgi:hypothetical protein
VDSFELIPSQRMPMLQGMAKNIQRTLRYPEDFEPRIEAIARALSRPGYEANTTDALRFIVTVGIASAEGELGIKSASGKKGAAKRE